MKLANASLFRSFTNDSPDTGDLAIRVGLHSGAVTVSTTNDLYLYPPSLSDSVYVA